ncbi:HopJ type III effector protein [Solimonas terrae]|uniref:HopJ type III effector protein n=1 Tax=Solimonas terrae TaxID=1396819 RepID=A0A6M2BNF7_9GAMM|nr:HopJ type III effector protein [Solimonas terrae]NGY04136.1 HopJ type III effector protein [Solimonas terrae]
MSVDAFLKRLRETPDEIEFADTIATIDGAYDYTPTAFRNGEVHNEAGQNAGSCKLLSFARLRGLSEAETLACFGRFYREDVLKNPDGSDHQNIRNFMRTGWGGVVFEGRALQSRPGLKKPQSK